ncbi:unnamed protein product [Brassica napus]|nr:unnamed protein product [Brassica napus]
MPTNRNRPINTISYLVVFFLLSTATAARNESNRTHGANRRFQHAYYSYPHRSCQSFSRPYARSMCIELERIHRSSRQPLFSPPPPPPPPPSPPEIDESEQREEPVPMGPAVELWKETEMAKTKTKYEKLCEKIVLWADKKTKKAKRKLHRTERGVEKTKLKALQRYTEDNERIGIIVASARAHAYERQMKEELKVKEKVNLMRTTGRIRSLYLILDDSFNVMMIIVYSGIQNFSAAMMYQAVPTATTSRGGIPTESGDYVVTLDQIPRWSDVEQRSSSLEGGEAGDPSHSNPRYANPLASSSSEAGSSGNGMVSKFPVDHEINSRIYLWRGEPWNLEVDAVVNSTNENLDEAHSSPGLHAAAGPGLAEQCATLGGCRTGMAKVTNAYDLPARRVIHTVGPKYAVKYHTAAENALSHCYRSCLELLIDNGLQSIATDCIYTEAKNYPREPAAHVSIRTVRRFLEKHKDKISAVVFCTTTSSDTEIYKRLLPLYFPRDEHEEEVAISKLPADVGDENGETVIDERKIRIQALPNKPQDRSFPALVQRSSTDLALVRRNSNHLDSYLDPTFMSLIKDPDERRQEQWEKTAQAQSGFNFVKLLGFGDLGGPPLSAAEEYSLHSRYLAKANSLNLSEIAEMKIVYRGGVDTEGHPVMVVVGAHFLLRCLDLERFVLYVVKEFEPLIQKPYSIVYFHSAASLQVQPDLGWMKRLQQILGRKHQRNLQAIYVLHPTLQLKATILAMQMFVNNVVWKKVVYADRLLQLFKYVPREQLTIPDFVFQHDLEVNGGKGLIVDPRTKYVYQRP